MVQVRAEMMDSTEKFPDNTFEFPRAIATSEDVSKLVLQNLDSASILSHEDFSHSLVNFFSRLPSGNCCFPLAPANLQLGNQVKVTALKYPAISFCNSFRSSKSIRNKGFDAFFQRFGSGFNRPAPINGVFFARQHDGLKKYRKVLGGGFRGSQIQCPSFALKPKPESISEQNVCAGAKQRMKTWTSCIPIKRTPKPFRHRGLRDPGFVG